MYYLLLTTCYWQVAAMVVDNEAIFRAALGLPPSPPPGEGADPDADHLVVLSIGLAALGVGAVATLVAGLIIWRHRVSSKPRNIEVLPALQLLAETHGRRA